MENFSVYCIKYAESVLPESMVFDGGKKEKNIPISFAIYLIKGENRNILVDAGCDTLASFDMKRFYSPAFALRQMDISPDDITDVILTHSHHDHIEAVKHFKNAVIHISKNEYEMGKEYISKEQRVLVFENEFAIIDGVKVIELAGHSKGSAIVEIGTETPIHIIAGDECYTNENIEKSICTGLYYNKLKATQFVEKYNDKKYIVHTCHDSSLKTERII